MKTFAEIHEEKLLEVRLGRIYQDFTDKKNAAAIITAFRGENLETDQANLKALGEDFRRAGCGYTYLDGKWVEPDGTKKTEVSLLVTTPDSNEKALYDTCMVGAQRYNQEAFIFRSSRTNWATTLFDRAGDTLRTFNNTNFTTGGMSTLLSGPHAGRSFVFEEFTIKTPSDIL